MFKFLSGAAALALIATPAFADPGNGKGNGGGNGKSAAATHGNANAGNGKSATGGKPDRANGNQTSKPAKMVQAQANKAAPSNAANGKIAGNSNGNGNGNGNGSAARIDAKPGKSYNPSGTSRDFANDIERRVDGKGGYRVIDRRGDYDGTLLHRALNNNRGLIDGCPPGLARKHNGCLPPGQAKKTYANYRPALFGLTGLRGSDYYYNDGYLMRYNDRGLLGFIPLLGGALSAGQLWPATYQSYALPDYHVNYYGLGGRDNYRYANNVIYRVDPETAAISSIVALLTGDDFAIGQPMPAGYDVYNVPYGYRDQYYDTPDARYRYADGYIYRIDPETALITAAIEMLI